MKKFRKIGVEITGLNGENEVQSFDLENCLHFSIECNGDADVWMGFSPSSQPLPLKQNQFREFPWVDPDCMRYQGTLYVKFGAGSNVMITSLYDTNS